MDKTLEQTLLTGEKVLWSGASAPFPLLDKRQKNGPKIVAQWIATVVITAGLLWAYLSNNQPGSPAFVGGVLFVAALVALSPVPEWKNVQAQRYVITDRRVLLIQRFSSVFSIRLDHIDDFRLVEGKTPEGTLVLGSAVFEDIDRQLRWRACHPKTNVQSDGPSDRAQGLVFFSVSDSKKAADCLRQQMGRAA